MAFLGPGGIRGWAEVSELLSWGAACRGGSDQGVSGSSGAAPVGRGQAKLRQQQPPTL